MESTRALSKRETHDRVIDASARLFAESGYASATIRDIAEASGVSVGTVMAVGDKNALLVRVFEDRIQHMHLSGDTASPGPRPGTSPALTERLLGLLRPFVSLFTADPALSRAYLSVVVSGRHPSSLFTTLRPLLEDEITRLLPGTTPAAADPRATARAIYFLYIGVLVSWTTRGDSETSAEAIEAELADVFDTFTKAAR